ncbi:MAG TPA: glycosyltransferase [Rhodanobacteraceae bacterium]|nr:glycosyltransferase [Rhodanobacteraceae bacterium]
MIRVHLVARDNGAGLSRDLEILRVAIGEAGFDLTISAIGAGGLRRQLQFARVRAKLAWRGFREGRAHARFDVNLMDERLRPKYVPLARRNVLMPHPEWFDVAWTKDLGLIDSVFAKTRHAVPLFEALGCRADFVGFTSIDRRLADVPREPTFFHLGGRSGNKGTQATVDAWLRHPEWPLVTIIQRKPLKLPPTLPSNIRLITDYIDDADLRTLQNRNLFHLCPSETEGFGHHLVEGMSVGAITLATDAPPMNEMVTNERGVLVPYVRSGTQQLATTYFVDGAAIEAGVARMLALDAAQRRSLSDAAREWWEQNDRAFRQRLATAIRSLAGR